MSKLKENFTRVYTENIWGKQDESHMSKRKNKKFYSGGGTDPDNDKNNTYINLIQSYINRPDISTVVEIGCGDWEVSSRIDWSGVDYTGYDLVESLIDYNTEHFGSGNIKFICDDTIISNNATKADLIIVKDVFQHLPPSFCKDFIKSIPMNFKYNIITNDYSNNNEIEIGGYCGNDFSQEPFNMKYRLVIQWQQKYVDAGNKQTVIFE